MYAHLFVFTCYLYGTFTTIKFKKFKTESAIIKLKFKLLVLSGYPARFLKDKAQIWLR